MLWIGDTLEIRKVRRQGNLLAKKLITIHEISKCMCSASVSFCYLFSAFAFFTVHRSLHLFCLLHILNRSTWLMSRRLFRCTFLKNGIVQHCLIFCGTSLTVVTLPQKVELKRKKWLIFKNNYPNVVFFKQEPYIWEERHICSSSSVKDSVWWAEEVLICQHIISIPLV